MKQITLLFSLLLSLSAFAGQAGVIEVHGKITKITDLKNTPCEMTPYQYYVTGDYVSNGVTKNFAACFESVAIPLDGSQDHGGSVTGNLMTDAKNTLESLSGKPVTMTFTVFDTEKLIGGLQTMLSIYQIRN